MPPENSDSETMVGNRMLGVNIQKAHSLHDALLQLEESYNERYNDIPLVIELVHMTYVTAHLPFREGEFSLSVEKPIREIIIDILDALEEKQLSYFIGLKRVSPSWKWPAAFYDNNIKHYYLSIDYPGIFDKNIDAPPLWGLNIASPFMEQRTRRYYERINPELFDGEMQEQTTH